MPSTTAPRATAQQALRFERITLAVLIVAGIGALWLPSLTRSFWLDETGTFWVVKDDLGDAIDRSRVQGQTPLYYVIAWGARRLLGDSEIALRAPSIIAASLCVYLLYRIGKRLFDQKAGAIAALIAVTSGGIAFAATDARPYALAAAALAGSALALITWLDTGQTRAALAWAVCAALTVALSYTFVLGIMPQAVYAAIRVRTGTVVRLRQLTTAVVGFLILSVPMLPRLIDLWRRNDLLTWHGDITLERAAQALIPPVVAASATAVMVFGWTGPARIKRALGGRPGGLAMVLAWAYVPTMTMLTAGLLVSGKFFQTRYFLPAALGMALFGGRFLGVVDSPAARIGAAVVLVAGGLLAAGDGVPQHHWREAAAVIHEHADAATPVLLHSGFATRRSHTEKAGGELLIAPAIAYEMEGRIMSLPYNIVPETEPQLERIARRIEGSERILITVSFEVDDFVSWLERRLAPVRYRVTSVFSKPQLEVTMMERLG